MDNNILVTIIMSNYNQEKYIKTAIESVLSQKTNFNWQLIITDDNSTKDSSVKIIREYEKKYPDKIKALYNKENGRYLINILRAKAITKTPYFTLLDADDYWTDENYLQDAVNFLEKHPDFTIYSRNVICKNEDGSEHLYKNEKLKDGDYTIEDYFNNKCDAITQTTGSFFRNVIFSKGIPEIMKKAVGTISERSFEGDTDRYVMHLKYGKAHYEAKPSGVYRILSSGIWASMNDFEKRACEAQAYIDYCEYFENEHLEFFVNMTYMSTKACIKALNQIETKDMSFSEMSKKIFFAAIEFCNKHRDKIKLEEAKTTPSQRKKPSKIVSIFRELSKLLPYFIAKKILK